MQTDNTTACFSLAKANAKYHLRKAVDSILQIEEENGWTLTIRRIAGNPNKDADALSRLLIVGDYSTKRERLEEVLKGWQVEITVCLFAARIDAQYKSYYILTKDKKAYGQDAIRIPWEEKFVLIYPPTPKIIRLKEITVKEKKLGESEKVLEKGPKMRRRNLKVPPGRILALEVNRDKMEQNYFEMLQKPPDYQEMQLNPQQITGMEV
ncbi:MAG: hypothetical protein EZS28_042540, partial [Streblomastix strix]